jgi:porphobilinogen synthase
MVAETVLSPRNLVQPLFVCPGRGQRRPVRSMPGVNQLSVDQAVKEAREVFRLGIPAVILFGIPSRKDPMGREAYAADGVVQTAARALKDALPDLVVITDLCLCEYTDHGHCGVLREGTRKRGFAVDNDATLELLGQIAVSQAEAGADVVAPSGMMDGGVQAVRRALDDGGCSTTVILAYAAKYASAFYGPFRDAAESAPRFGDRKAYQMDPANAREALREAALDVEEGADIVMVKPALAYLDVIRQVRESLPVPVAAYNVSGEYAMVKAAAGRGWVDEAAVTREILLAIKRAGADIIVSYHAREAARRLAP